MADTPKATAPGTEEEERNAAEETVTLLQPGAQPSTFEQEAPAPDEALKSLDEEKGEGTWQARKSVVVGVLACVVWVLTLVLYLSFAANGWFEHQPVTRFFVIGDWGREGGQNQSEVAAAMAAKAATAPPDFIISVGDNMYESGLISPEDEQFKTTFIDVYNHSSLQVPWHVILGNHDYGEHESQSRLSRCPTAAENCFFSPLHELHERLQERDPRWNCKRSFQLPALGGAAQFFFIDTTPFIQYYYSEPWASNRGGLLEQSWESQLLELEADLARSTADWKLVVGHHPVRNSQPPGHTPELVEHLEPILEAQGVQTYFCGHEHNLQLLRMENGTTHYVISGAGSRSNYTDDAWIPEGNLFHHMGSGFVSCTLTTVELACEYIGIASEQVLHAFRIQRPQ